MDFGILWYFLAFFGGIVAYGLFIMLAERRAISIVRTKASGRAVEAKKDAQEDLMGFLIDVKTAFDAHKQGGGDLKAFAVTKLPGILASHPQTVLRFGSRLYKLMQTGEGGSIDGLSSLLGIEG